jgi:hypothetical protein
MRIDLQKRRRGEIGIEAMLILPVAIVIVLLSRFILEGMLVRQEVGVYTRSGTAAAAQAESRLPIYCTSDRDPFSARPAVDQTALMLCLERAAEGGLTSQPEFWPAVRQGSDPYPRMMRDVYQDDRVMDMAGDGFGTSTFARPRFLADAGMVNTSAAALFPQQTLWTHEDEPLKSSYDPVLWDALQEPGSSNGSGVEDIVDTVAGLPLFEMLGELEALAELGLLDADDLFNPLSLLDLTDNSGPPGTWRLFPNVFPARDGG